MQLNNLPDRPSAQEAPDINSVLVPAGYDLHTKAAEWNPALGSGPRILQAHLIRQPSQDRHKIELRQV